jgi:fido (protein-threonine AMPylation protein)
MRTYDNPHDWEYSTHPNKEIIGQRCIALGAGLLSNSTRFLCPKSRYKSTLRAHKYVFRLFTPPGYPFYAGNYRGSNFPILRDYIVGIRIDPKVGTPPARVKKEMALFDKQFEQSMDRFEQQFKIGKRSKAELLTQMVEYLANFLVRFLTIHPYANGNGHMARLLVLAMLGRVGIRPVSWTLDDRPPYDKAIFEYRRGNVRPLNMVIMQCICGASPK